MIVIHYPLSCTCGCSQNKAVRSRNKQHVEDKIDSRETNKQEADLGTQHKSGSQDSVDTTDDLSAEYDLRRNNSDDSITDTALAVPKEERRVSITLTTSGGPSKTFMTDLKTTDLNTVNKKH